MTIEITKKPDFKLKVKEINDSIEKALKVALEERVTAIVQRTQRGIGADGVQFQAYTDKYKRAKQFATGRGDTVDLVGFNYKRLDGKQSQQKRTQPGSMLASMTSTVKRFKNAIEGRIYFIGAKQSAKARGNQARRNFFNLSKQDIKEITAKIRNP